MTPPCGVLAVRGTTLPVLHLHRRLQPALDIEQHPRRGSYDDGPP
jgi:chemotaxis signal transduction protein